MRHLKGSVFLFFLLSLCLPPEAGAGSLTIYPVRVYLKAGGKGGEIRVYNPKNGLVYLQVGGYSWGQDEEGNPVYGEPEGLVFFPKILRLEPETERVIRVTYRGDWPGVERAYRLFLREVPVSRPGDRVLRLALKIEMPVFVVPEEVERSIEIRGLRIGGGRVSVGVRNTGNVHIMVKEVSWRGLDREGRETFHRGTKGWYLLPHVERRYGTGIGTEECVRTATVEVVVRAEELQGSSTFTLPEGRSCGQ